jgi:hypothetical protein
MALLLVDDRDGRILCERETEEQLLELLERLADQAVPEYLCPVEMRDRPGALLGTHDVGDDPPLVVSRAGEAPAVCGASPASFR